MLEHLGIFDCKVKFWTQDLFLQQLAESLNEEIKELLKDGTYRWSDDDDDNGMLMAAEEISPVVQEAGGAHDLPEALAVLLDELGRLRADQGHHRVLPLLA